MEIDKKKSLVLRANKEINMSEDSNDSERKKFSFSNFSDEFDNHINNSIRGYADLRNDVVSISKYFVENDTRVIDLGCSQGSLLRAIKYQNNQATTAEYLGIDINNSFSKHWKNEEKITYLTADITEIEFPKNLSFITSLFTMQFIPERKRFNLIKNIHQNLLKGGAFVFSEKFLSDDGKSQNILDSLYHEFKRKNFTEQEIMDKEKELRHLMKCSYERSLIEQLEEVGFSNIQCFWRNFNFAAFYAVKVKS
jgi:tRNA (cmo5U34)-methyltransferase